MRQKTNFKQRTSVKRSTHSDCKRNRHRVRELSANLFICILQVTHNKFTEDGLTAMRTLTLEVPLTDTLRMIRMGY